jgi:hypothetical protein
MLWREATTSNGIMGTKYGVSEPLPPELTTLPAGLLPHAPDPDGGRRGPHCTRAASTYS